MRIVRTIAFGVVLVSGSAAAAVSQGVAPVPGAAPGASEVRKPRIFVTESDSWQQNGGSGAGSGGGFGAFGAGSLSSGGARPQTAEIIKTLGQRCPAVVANSIPDASDYVLRLDHEGGKGLLSHRNKVAVFNRRTGDALFSESTLSLGGSVQDACAAIMKDWKGPVPELAVAGGAPLPMSTLTVEASVAGADVEIDGVFVGSAPSTISVTPGKHTVTVKQAGYADWTRTMSVAGPAVRLTATLNKPGA